MGDVAGSEAGKPGYGDTRRSKNRRVTSNRHGSLVGLAVTAIWVLACKTVDTHDADTELPQRGNDSSRDTSSSENGSDGLWDTGPREIGTAYPPGACYQGSFFLRARHNMEELYPYTCLTGSLHVLSNGIRSLDLPHLTDIGGSLIIQDQGDLQNLDGLYNLETIGENLEIGYIERGGTRDLAWRTCTTNDLLESIAGLESLTSVGGGVVICGTQSLTSLSGLENLTSIGAGLDIWGNQRLENTRGLSSLTTVGGLNPMGGSLEISENAALTKLGMDSLDWVEASIFIMDNESLAQCEVCDFMTQLTGFNGSALLSGNQEDTCSSTCE